MCTTHLTSAVHETVLKLDTKVTSQRRLKKAAPLKRYFYFSHVAFIFSPLGLGDPASGDGGGGVGDDQRAEGKSQSISRALSAGWRKEQNRPEQTLKTQKRIFCKVFELLKLFLFFSRN